MAEKRDNRDKKVLIVSEQRSVGNMLSFLFMSKGFQTEIKDSLREPSISAAINSESADFLVYDKPLLHDGNAETCRAIRESSPYRNIPQIVLSSSREECEGCCYLDSGRCSNVQKPFVSAELLSIVREFTA